MKQQDHPSILPPCSECGRDIGTGVHCLAEAGLVFCVGCLTSSSTIPMHAKYYDACPTPWHDMWDHPITIVEFVNLREGASR